MRLSRFPVCMAVISDVEPWALWYAGIFEKHSRTYSCTSSRNRTSYNVSGLWCARKVSCHSSENRSHQLVKEEDNNPMEQSRRGQLIRTAQARC